jgi:UDP-N-acetylmuramoyl-tripeptide--D-alanyl-D-alanine ligase
MESTTIEYIYQLFLTHHQKITTDTRKLEAGSIFFALKGDNFNANTFAQNAIAGGCSYAIVDEELVANEQTILYVKDVLETLQQLAKHHRSQLKIPIIGITGSNGKTTNKELIHAVLSKKYNTYATKGNLNNHIGVPLTLLATTAKHEIAIVEMGANHQGEIELLSNISDPDFGLITNIGKAHLEGFGGEEGVKKGKSELYKHIKQKQGKLFINADDAVLMNLSGDIKKITYGLSEEYDVYGALIEGSEFVNFKWNTKHQSLENNEVIKTNLFGHYNFINVLCAACIGHYFGVETKDINQALTEYMPEMNRSQVKKTANNTLILDAYNANPSSMQLAIAHFMKQDFKSKLVILGDMLELGDFSKVEHKEILDQLLKDNIEYAVLIGELFYDHKNQFPHYQFFKNIEDATTYFKQQNLKLYNILIKGSRGIKLEKLVEYL